MFFVVCLFVSAAVLIVQPSYAPDFTVYSGPPAHLNTGKNALSASAGFFMAEKLRQELHQQQLSCLTLPTTESLCPKEVDHYHSLCPLEPVDATAADQVRGGCGWREKKGWREG